MISCGAGPSEDGCSVAVFVFVDQFDGFVKSLNVQADEYGTEDLFPVAAHLRCDVADDGWCNLRWFCELLDTIREAV